MKTEAELRTILDKIISIQDRLMALNDQCTYGATLQISKPDALQVLDMQRKLQPTFSMLHWTLETEASRQAPDEGTLTLEQYLFQCERFLCYVAGSLNKPPVGTTQSPQQKPGRL